MNKTSKYLFFWSGPFSQWAISPFVLQGMHFNCAEQWMMYSKALFFKDNLTADKIMQTDNPRIQKELGRAVYGYDDKEWMEEAFDIVVRGNRAKFTQNETFKKALYDSKDKIIVEASPYDCRWGIGLAETHPGIENPDNWRGENLLGKAIMQVRKEMFGK